MKLLASFTNFSTKFNPNSALTDEHQRWIKTPTNSITPKTFISKHNFQLNQGNSQLNRQKKIIITADSKSQIQFPPENAR